MFKTPLCLTLAAALLVGTVGCKEKKKPALKPGELSQVQKDELRKKALDNYKKLVERYPKSPYTAQAEERIQALTPPPKK